MRIALTFPNFAYFNGKTNPETPVLGLEKTKTETKIPQLLNANSSNEFITCLFVPLQIFLLNVT